MTICPSINKKNHEKLSILPIEIKSGKNYYVHNAINNLINIKNYNIQKGLVLSNNQEVVQKNNIIYLPIYYAMFI